jgi:hypothetical protein
MDVVKESTDPKIAGRKHARARRSDHRPTAYATQCTFPEP